MTDTPEAVAQMLVDQAWLDRRQTDPDLEIAVGALPDYDFGNALLCGLRKDIGDELVDEIIGGFDECPDPLRHTREAIACITTRPTDATVRQLVEALSEYLDAEEIDDPAIRLEELAACRIQARQALAAYRGQ